MSTIFEGAKLVSVSNDSLFGDIGGIHVALADGNFLIISAGDTGGMYVKIKDRTGEIVWFSGKSAEVTKLLNSNGLDINNTRNDSSKKIQKSGVFDK